MMKPLLIPTGVRSIVLALRKCTEVAWTKFMGHKTSILSNLIKNVSHLCSLPLTGTLTSKCGWPVSSSVALRLSGPTFQREKFQLGWNGLLFHQENWNKMVQPKSKYFSFADPTQKCYTVSQFNISSISPKSCIAPMGTVIQLLHFFSFSPSSQRPWLLGQIPSLIMQCGSLTDSIVWYIMGVTSDIISGSHKHQ